MSFPTLTFAQQLEVATRQELEQFVSLLQGYLSEQHKEDGTHGDVTADSLTVTADEETGATGNVTADGEIYAAGEITSDANIVADADESPTTIGAYTGTGTTGLDAHQTGTFGAHWRIVVSAETSPARRLKFRDMLEPNRTVHFYFAESATGTGVVNYSLLPGGSDVGLNLGEDTSGLRVDEVNAKVLRSNGAVIGKANSFIGNGAHLSLGVTAYTGRATTNPTNAINIYAGTAPAGNTGATPFVTLYAKDVAGTLKLAYMDSAGAETVL